MSKSQKIKKSTEPKEPPHKIIITHCPFIPENTAVILKCNFTKTERVLASFFEYDDAIKYIEKKGLDFQVELNMKIEWRHPQGDRITIKGE